MRFAATTMAFGMGLCFLACDSRGWTPSTPVNADPPEARLLAVLDSNDDGVLDAAEYARRSGGQADFSDADRDGDGRVDGPELRALMWSMETGPRGMGGGKEQRRRWGEGRRGRR
ncbi:MAG TPA: hypothetical protein DFR83_10725 [Deltaproteobacteria bacterium]|nr:hypothetical protein [Deltaproteobacteria bacterium]